MLTSLKLTGYRRFESYRLDGLTRVNLLVGRNNCGKTSILEAVDLVVAQGDPSVLRNAATRRSEHSVYETSSQLKESSPFTANFNFTVPSVSHTFFGHRCEQGVRFELSSGGNHAVSYEIVSPDRVPDSFETPALNDLRLAVAFGLEIRTGRPTKNGATEGLPVIPVTHRGELLGLLEWRRGIGFPKAPAAFLGIDPWTSKDLRAMWDDTIRQGREQEVVNTLRLLDPDLESIHFLTGTQTDGGILVGRRSTSDRLPIGSLGEGMRRLLVLSLAMTTTGGYLLVDEPDTGLHWTALDGMWRLLLATARRLDVQIFATTHSYDCIHGLASAIKAEPDLRDDVSVHKLHAELDESVRLSADDMQIAMAQDIEVR